MKDIKVKKSRESSESKRHCEGFLPEAISIFSAIVGTTRAILIVGFMINAVFIIGCSKPSNLNTKDYAAWIENPANGVCITKKISDFEFAVLYKPIEYVVAMESKNKNISKDSILKRRENLKGYQYFTFRIRSLKDNEFLKTGMTSQNEYYERLEYFVSNAQNDIKLVEEKDTIPCALYHFERNYGISPYSSIVLSFEEKDNSNTKDKVFIYEDKVLGIGKIAIKIKGSELSDLPKLNI